MLSFLVNAVYLLTLAALAPWLVWKALTTGKYRRGIWQRLLGIPHSAFCIPHSPVWFHGVSVGEIHLLRPILAEFQRRNPDAPVVISSTTETGLDEARKCFPETPVIRWQFDFSWAVNRLLAAIRPRLVVLAESELWPNFLLAAKRRSVPVVVVNARMSPRSFRRLSRLRWLVRRWFLLVEHVAAQTDEYAAMFENLGVPQSRISVTGSVKYDGIQSDCNNPKTESLRRLFGLTADDLVWVAGSTAATEEEICLRVFQKLQSDFPKLRLILVPRQKERFAEVTAMLKKSGLPFVRRSAMLDAGVVGRVEVAPIILLDTIGELSAAWGLADIAFVGGSLDGKRGGQNMIEPAAYGAAIVVGPHTWNFRDTVQRLVEADAAIRVGDEQELEKKLRRLLTNEDERTRIGVSAREFVLSQQGATAKTIDLIKQFLPSAIQSPAASHSLPEAA